MTGDYRTHAELLEQRRAALDRWCSTAERYAEAMEARARQSKWCSRLVGRRPSDEAVLRFLADSKLARDQAVEHCFGAAETTWGILSGGYYGSIGSARQFRLEITLAELIEDHQAEAPAWCKRLSAVTRQLLNARNAAVNGDHTLVET